MSEVPEDWPDGTPDGCWNCPAWSGDLSKGEPAIGECRKRAPRVELVGWVDDKAAERMPRFLTFHPSTPASHWCAEHPEVAGIIPGPVDELLAFLEPLMPKPLINDPITGAPPGSMPSMPPIDERARRNYEHAALYRGLWERERGFMRPQIGRASWRGRV